jgi:hypothetical protein
MYKLFYVQRFEQTNNICIFHACQGKNDTNLPKCQGEMAFILETGFSYQIDKNPAK